VATPGKQSVNNYRAFGAKPLEDVVRNLEESAKLQRAYCNYFDLVVVNESWEETFQKVMNALDDVEHESSWVPSKWVYS